MIINSTHVKPNIVSGQPTSNKSTAIEEDRLAEQKTPTSQESDSISLSTESLKLAKTSTVPGVTNRSKMTDHQQAQALAEQLVSNIQSQSNQAQTAFGRISQTQASSLLA